MEGLEQTWAVSRSAVRTGVVAQGSTESAEAMTDLVDMAAAVEEVEAAIQPSFESPRGAGLETAVPAPAIAAVPLVS